MSRKREQQREAKRELARQMGVSGRQVPQDLIDNQRTTEPEIKLRLTVDTLARGLLARIPLAALQPPPTHVVVHAALWCCAAQQARCVRSVVADADVAATGAVDWQPRTDDHGFDHVTYKRPGFFVVVATLHTASADGAVDGAITSDGIQRALTAADTVTIAGTATPLLRLVAQTAPTAAQVHGVGDVVVVAVAAADRVKTSIPLTLSSADGRLQATLHADLRL